MKKPESDDDDRHISKFEFDLRLKAMEWRLRFTIVLAVIAEVGLARVGNDKLTAIGLGALAVIGVGAKFIH